MKIGVPQSEHKTATKNPLWRMYARLRVAQDRSHRALHAPLEPEENLTSSLPWVEGRQGAEVSVRSLACNTSAAIHVQPLLEEEEYTSCCLFAFFLT